jgi:hypothetical protein
MVAARTGMILDIDDHLDTRQMRRQRIRDSCAA